MSMSFTMQTSDRSATFCTVPDGAVLVAGAAGGRRGACVADAPTAPTNTITAAVAVVFMANGCSCVDCIRRHRSRDSTDRATSSSPASVPSEGFNRRTRKTRMSPRPTQFDAGGAPFNDLRRSSRGHGMDLVSFSSGARTEPWIDAQRRRGNEDQNRSLDRRHRLDAHRRPRQRRLRTVGLPRPQPGAALCLERRPAGPANGPAGVS